LAVSDGEAGFAAAISSCAEVSGALGCAAASALMVSGGEAGCGAEASSSFPELFAVRRRAAGADLVCDGVASVAACWLLEDVFEVLRPAADAALDVSDRCEGWSLSDLFGAW
jgi:hypothetical protein